jgi:hypothetical protein
VHTPTEHMSADSLTKELSPRVFSGACDSYGFIRVFCSTEYVGVMCSFVSHEYSFCVVMYCSVRICVNHDIGVVIKGIVYESQLTSCEYVVITIVLFVFYTCILCLDHVQVLVVCYASSQCIITCHLQTVLDHTVF